MEVSVIISTYNHPEWLEKVLWGYQQQTTGEFEVVIADDGSGEPTRELIDTFRESSKFPIRHVWHPDDGFQKSAILNKAIMASKGEYLIFSDGDCIPRNDFVEVHKNKAEKGYFLSGGYFKLPMETSKKIGHEHIEDGRVFDVSWLYENGLEKTYKSLKLTSKNLQEDLLNFFTPTKASWNGHNSSGWKEDLLKVNGFNEEMQYGGQDRELGERLVNLGLKGKQIRYSAICVHLDHARGYNTPESINKNKNIRKETRESGRAWTEFGIKRGAEEDS